jgi:hypothetical protein
VFSHGASKVRKLAHTVCVSSDEESITHPLTSPTAPDDPMPQREHSAIPRRSSGWRGQLSIEPINFSLFPTQFLVFGSELLFHLIQPTA